MDIIAKNGKLSGDIVVPSSKSHTIRALILAMLANGSSRIHNPLHSVDCISTVKAIQLLGAMVDTTRLNEWIVIGAGRDLQVPSDVINVGNSGSLLYFLAPICATLNGTSVFTGDTSIRRRPVRHMTDAITALGANAFTTQPSKNSPPIVVTGAMGCNKTLETEGAVSSQYISGVMIAASIMDGTTTIKLSNPKETPFLQMTRVWLEELGVKVEITKSFKEIKVTGVKGGFSAFDKVVPSDWEAVAFPLVAALITRSTIRIMNIDTSKTQGDAAIVDALKLMGADISEEVIDNGGAKQTNLVVKPSYLSLEHFSDRHLTVNLSGYPDALCAMAVAACFNEGTLVLEDIGVCRHKETDRIDVMQKELTMLGAIVKTGDDWMSITGHSPFLKDGSINPSFNLNGANVDSHKDHRVAMALSCAGLGIRNGKVRVKDGECCAVSFPHFVKTMNKLGASFVEV